MPPPLLFCNPSLLFGSEVLLVARSICIFKHWESLQYRSLVSAFEFGMKRHLVVSSCLVSVFQDRQEDLWQAAPSSPWRCGQSYSLLKAPITTFVLFPIWGRLDMWHFLSHWGLLTERLWFSFDQ